MSMDYDMNQTAKYALYREMTPAEVTKAFDVMDEDAYVWLAKNRERSPEVAKELKPFKDIAYGKEECQKLDIYIPKGGDVEGAPVLVDIHGGGWCTGSKNSRSIPAKRVTENGIIWVTIEYGFAPTYSIDDIIDHVRQAIAWVYKNIASYGGDPEKIYVTGNSAGGHLAATSLMPDWHERYHLPKDVIRGAFCVSGIYNMECMMYAEIESKDALKLTEDDAKRTSPLYHLPEGDPAIILAYGQKEPFGYSREANIYAEALRKAGKDVQVIEVANHGHFTIMNDFENADSELFKAILLALKPR